MSADCSISFEFLYQPKTLLEICADRLDRLVESWLPECWDWDETDVGDWVQIVLELPYRECFEVNFVTGKKLINLEARHLTMMNIKHWEHIQFITRNIRAMFHQNLERYHRPLAEDWPNLLEQYWRMRADKNFRSESFSFSDFLEMKKMLRPRRMICGVEERGRGRANIKVGRTKNGVLCRF